MTPFMLRLLDAELPLYCREADVALDRLFLLKESCEKVHQYINLILFGLSYVHVFVCSCCRCLATANQMQQLCGGTGMLM